jgi:hypothetical protein
MQLGPAADTQARYDLQTDLRIRLAANGAPANRPMPYSHPISILQMVPGTGPACHKETEK